jgi:hypothetical protein
MVLPTFNKRVNGEALAIAARLKILQLVDRILDTSMNTVAEGGVKYFTF